LRASPTRARVGPFFPHRARRLLTRAAVLMLGGVYEDSDSDEGEGKEEENQPTQATEEARQEDVEDEDDESEDEGEGKPLPSAGKVFASMGTEDLAFKKFADAAEKRKRVGAHAMSMDRVPAASAKTLRGQGWDPSAAAAKPEIGGDRRDEDAAAESGAADGEKGFGKGKMTHKERTKLKRFKGQSGVDHSGRTWKPEAWMNMRAQFD